MGNVETGLPASCTIAATAASAHLQRPQNRQPLDFELLRLGHKLGEVFFGGLQRLALLDDLLSLKVGIELVGIK